MALSSTFVPTTETLDESYYTHELLDHNISSIRLIRVLPDLSSDVLIQCHIFTALIPPRTNSSDLEDHNDFDRSDVSYICLSYMWGPSSDDYHIRVNGKLFRIRRNLFEFLQVARQRYFGQQLWIDALCINQDNTSERNHQVQQMGNIYTRAKLVLVWLGFTPDIIELFLELDEANQSHTLQNFEREYSQLTHSTRTRQARKEYLNEDAMINGLDLDAYGRPQPGTTQYPAGKLNRLLNAFAKDDYWTRAWVTQEILLAQQVFVVAGWQGISLAQVAFAHRAVSGYLSETAFGHFSDLILERKCRRGKTPIKRWGLINLLQHFHDKKCANPQDRIYSLLALCGTGKNLKVDYDIPKEQLMRQVLSTCESALCLCSMAVVTQSLSPWNFSPKPPDEETSMAEFHICALALNSNMCPYCLNWIPYSWTQKKGVMFCLKMSCTDTHGHLFWERQQRTPDPNRENLSGMMYAQARRENKSRGLCNVGSGIKIGSTEWQGVFILRFTLRCLIEVLQEELLDEPGLRSCGNLWPNAQEGVSGLERMRFCVS